MGLHTYPAPDQPHKATKPEAPAPMTTGEKVESATKIAVAGGSIALSVATPPVLGVKEGLPGFAKAGQEFSKFHIINGITNTVTGIITGAVGFLGGGGAGQGASTVMDGVGAATGVSVPNSDLGTIIREGKKLNASAKASEITSPQTAPRDAPKREAPRGCPVAGAPSASTQMDTLQHAERPPRGCLKTEAAKKAPIETKKKQAAECKVKPKTFTPPRMGLDR